MRLDGGHPALELVNTIYATVGGPVDFDVLTTPGDLVTFARRVGAAGDAAVSSAGALSAARALREALDPLLRAQLAGRGDARGAAARSDGDAARRRDREAAGRRDRDATARGAAPHSARLVATSWGEADVAAATRAFEGAVRAAQDTARLAPGYAWAWDDADPLSPVHRLAHSAARLLTGDDLALLRCCDACCWLFLDRAGKGRKWCSMADCGTEAKKRRYVERRRRRRAAQ